MNIVTKSSSKALIVYKRKLLLFLRDNNNSIPDPNTWSLVGGEVNEKESHEDAMLREMEEEINIIPRNIKYLGKLKTPDGNSHAIFLVKPTKDEVTMIRIGNEGQKVAFFSFDEIKKLVLAKNVKKYFDIYGCYLEKVLNSDEVVNPEQLGLTQ